MARAKPPVVAPAGRQGGQEAGSRQAAVTIPRALAYITLVGLAVLFLWLTIRADLVIFAGVLFGICLRRTAAALRRLTRLPIGWSLLVVFLLILAFFVGTGWFFLERISSQITELSVQLPAAAAKVGDMISQSALGKMLMHHLAVGNLQAFPTTALQSFFGAAINVAGVLGGIVVIMSIALYVAAEAERYAAGLVLLVPPARRARAAEILHEAANAMWYWMLGRLFAMSVLGVIIALGLWLLGVPLPAALGLLAGTMLFVPYIGSILSALPSGVIAASIDLTLATYVIALYVGVHIIESNVLVPMVQRRVMHLPPALTLSAQIILAVLAGFLGLLFATPLVAVAIVMIRMIYVEDILGDRGMGKPAQPV